MDSGARGRPNALHGPTEPNSWCASSSFTTPKPRVSPLHSWPPLPYCAMSCLFCPPFPSCPFPSSPPSPFCSFWVGQPPPPPLHTPLPHRGRGVGGKGAAGGGWVGWRCNSSNYAPGGAACRTAAAAAAWGDACRATSRPCIISTSKKTFKTKRSKKENSNSNYSHVSARPLFDLLFFEIQN